MQQHAALSANQKGKGREELEGEDEPSAKNSASCSGYA